MLARRRIVQEQIGDDDCFAVRSNSAKDSTPKVVVRFEFRIITSMRFRRVNSPFKGLLITSAGVVIDYFFHRWLILLLLSPKVT